MYLFTLSHIEAVAEIEIVSAFSLLAREQLHRFAPNLASLFLETKKSFIQVKTLEKVS
jgi:hypothetical protein